MKRVLHLGVVLALALGVLTAAAVGRDAQQAGMAGANYRVAEGNVYSWAGFPAPCSNPSSALILMEKQGPAAVLLGDTFSYSIQVSNQSGQDIISVTLEDVLPEGFSVQAIEPAPTRRGNGGTVAWDLGAIAANTAQRIVVTGRADTPGCLTTKSLARISYEMPLPLAVMVLQCNVDVRQQLPAVVDACDPIELVLTAVNQGTAPATNVVIADTLPEGLTTADGERSFSIAVGTLPVGGQRSFTVRLSATRTGDFDNVATITADRDCRGESEASMRVVSGDLRLAAGAPTTGYINTLIPYSIQVTNKGNGTARDVSISHAMSNIFQVTNVSEGGRIGEGRVVWSVGDLAPGETRLVGLEGTGRVEGQVLSDFRVMGRCLEGKSAKHTLDLRGVAGVLTSVRDDCDPVAVGGTVVYTITASNTGSRDDHDLRYMVELDEGMELVEAKGATNVERHEGRSLSFQPLPVLRAGQTAVWEVSVKMGSAGDKRLTANLLTRQLRTPVGKAESTTVYQPNMKMVVAE